MTFVGNNSIYVNNILLVKQMEIQIKLVLIFLMNKDNHKDKHLQNLCSYY